MSARTREHELVGRDGELLRIATFLDRVPAGPAALLLEGEPGVGKSALWRFAAGAARERPRTRRRPRARA